MELVDFATAKHPLRCSKIPAFMACAWSQIMQFLEIYHRDGGGAADTGSAMHKAVKKYHLSGKEVDALAEMKAKRREYPLADLAEAERLFRLYTADPRNQTAKVVHAECYLQGEIQDGIVVEGTLDQIREEEDGTWKVMDLKTSRFAGPSIRDGHTYQIAAYAYLATKRFKREVLPGAIIMARGYEKGLEKVFYPYQLTTNDVEHLMEMVAHRVREVRAGHPIAIPGEHCGYCIGVPQCMAKLRDYNASR